MKKLIVLIIFCLSIINLFSTEMLFNINETCKNDTNLTLNSVILKDNSSEFNFTYINSGKSSKSIGVYPPESENSIFLYNYDASKIYRLIDLQNIPKWWPTKKYVLKSKEKLDFTLIFEPLEPTISVSMVEGKNNFNSKTAWNFINIPVNSYSFLEKKIISKLDKINLTEEEKKFLEDNRIYEFINDFISYYKNKTPEMKQLYLSKWGKNIKTTYFIDFLLKKDYDSLILKPNLEKSYQIISSYPLTNTAKKLKKFIKPILLKKLHTEFNSIKQENSLEKCALFLKKYSKYENLYNTISDLNDAKTLLKKLIIRKREELKNANDPTLYKKFFKKYGTNIFKNTIYSDYLNLEKVKYNQAIISNNLKLYEKFLQDFPNSKYKNEIHKKYFEYLKNNDVSVDIITKYVGKYPDSPYIDDIVKLIPQKNNQTLPKKISEKKTFTSLQDKIDFFKNNVKNGTILHYNEKTVVENPNTHKEQEYEITYATKVITVLKTKLRIKIIDATLNLENPPSFILNNFKDIRDIMIGTIEDMEITKFEEFKKL